MDERLTCRDGPMRSGGFRSTRKKPSDSHGFYGIDKPIVNRTEVGETASRSITTNVAKNL